MNNTLWSDAELTDLADALKKYPACSLQYIAEQIAPRFPLRTMDGLRINLGRLRAGQRDFPDPEAEGYITRWTDYPRVSGNTMVAGDLQLPFYHVGMTEKLLDVAERFGVKQLALGGDVFDLPYWSRFDITRAQQKMSWDEDKKFGKRVFQKLCEQFDHIYIVADNHTRRFLRKLDFKTSIAGFYGDVVGELLAEKVVASDYPICEINSTWLVVHPSAYRQLKLSLASDLAMKFGRNVINFHGHLAAVGFAKYGFGAIPPIIADGACLTDPQLHEYTSLAITPHPQWNSGFYMIRNNWIYPFWDAPTFDWDFWLKGGP